RRSSAPYIRHNPALRHIADRARKRVHGHRRPSPAPIDPPYGTPACFEGRIPRPPMRPPPLPIATPPPVPPWAQSWARIGGAQLREPRWTPGEDNPALGL